MKTINVVLLLVFFLSLLSCGSYLITKDSLVTQLKENQDEKEILHWTPIGYTKYPSNNLEKIVCQNSKEKYVYLYPDKNTTIEIKSKSSNNVFKAYFDTVIYKDGKLHGLYSRIVGGLQEINVDDIESIEFHAELPKTKELSEKELKEIQNKQSKP